MEWLSTLHFTPLAWACMWVGVAAAYVVFGMAGFGTALVAGPVLVCFMPLARIMPLLVVLDFIAALGNLLPSRKAVAGGELIRLLPCMAIGCTLGVIFLLNLHSQWLVLLMGLFLSAYAFYSLWVKSRPRSLAAIWALPTGVVGGVFGALFGSGGFLYAIYLNARLAKEPARATQSALISCSAVVRLTLFITAGVYAQGSLLVLAGLLLPAMALGLWMGRRLTLNMPRERFIRLVNIVVLLSGLALIGRYLGA